MGYQGSKYSYEVALILIEIVRPTRFLIFLVHGEDGPLRRTVFLTHSSASGTLHSEPASVLVMTCPFQGPMFVAGMLIAPWTSHYNALPTLFPRGNG